MKRPKQRRQKRALARTSNKPELKQQTTSQKTQNQIEKPSDKDMLIQLVRNLYETTTLTMIEIEELTSIANSTLYEWKEKQNWTRQEQRIKADMVDAFQQDNKEGNKAKPFIRRALPKNLRKALINELWHSTAQQVRDIQARANSTKSATAAEKETRLLSSLARTVEKLLELEQDERKAKTNPTDKTTQKHPIAEKLEADLDTLRAQLTRRLTTLREGGAA